MTEETSMLVTGANGWLGRRVVRALTEGHSEMGQVGAGGRRVRILVRPGEKVDDLLELGVQKVEGDLRDQQAMEEWLRAVPAASFPPITIVRAPWFYGPEQPARQTRFFSMIKAGRFPIVGGGHNRRSMGYVDSLAYGILLAAQVPQAAGRL